MEKLKDPAMVLSIVNTVGLVGGIYYSYKQIETLNLEIDKLNNNLKAVVSNMAEIKKLNKTTSDQTQLLTNQMNQINTTVHNLSSLTDDVSDIIDTLYEHEIEVIKTDRSHRSGDRRDNRENYRGYAIEEKKPHFSERRQESERKPERRPEKKPERKSERKFEKRREPEKDPIHSENSEEDDNELIRGVRENS